jgi:hypothetical protein
MVPAALFVPGHIFTVSEPRGKLQPGGTSLKSGCLRTIADSPNRRINCEKYPFALPCSNNCRQVLQNDANPVKLSLFFQLQCSTFIIKQIFFQAIRDSKKTCAPLF